MDGGDVAARVEFSAKTKNEAYERAGGHCEKCKRPLATGDIEYDHRIPWDTSHDSSSANIVCLCCGCHREKTRSDIKSISKGRRIRNKNRGIRKARGFQTNRNGPFKRKMDGTIEKRR
jgi:5-methylcytosine-specific restriction protein A